MAAVKKEEEERVDALNVTPLRKIARDASHIYGKVEWAPGSYKTLRLVKEDVLHALRRDQSSEHPPVFDFRIGKEGELYLGSAEDVDQFFAKLVDQMKQYGVQMTPENIELMSIKFRRTLSDEVSEAE